MNSATCPKARSRTHKLELRQRRPADVGFRTNLDVLEDWSGRAILAELGYVAAKTIDLFTRLYEQEPREALASAQLVLYVRRWIRWTEGAVGS